MGKAHALIFLGLLQRLAAQYRPQVLAIALHGTFAYHGFDDEVGFDDQFNMDALDVVAYDEVVERPCERGAHRIESRGVSDLAGDEGTDLGQATQRLRLRVAKLTPRLDLYRGDRESAAIPETGGQRS